MKIKKQMSNCKKKGGKKEERRLTLPNRKLKKRLSWGTKAGKEWPFWETPRTRSKAFKTNNDCILWFIK
jgi:hypothetical protein